MKSSAVFIAVAALVSGIVLFFVGRSVGFSSGYKAAYVPEHSHYLFEQKRAHVFENRILAQRRCIGKMVSRIPPVRDAGFAGIGEEIAAVGLLFRGTTECDRLSGFGAPSSVQIHRIMVING